MNEQLVPAPSDDPQRATLSASDIVRLVEFVIPSVEKAASRADAPAGSSVSNVIRGSGVGVDWGKVATAALSYAPAALKLLAAGGGAAVVPGVGWVVGGALLLAAGVAAVAAARAQRIRSIVQQSGKLYWEVETDREFLRGFLREAARNSRFDKWGLWEYETNFSYNAVLGDGRTGGCSRNNPRRLDTFLRLPLVYATNFSNRAWDGPCGSPSVPRPNDPSAVVVQSGQGLNLAGDFIQVALAGGSVSEMRAVGSWSSRVVQDLDQFVTSDRYWVYAGRLGEIARAVSGPASSLFMASSYNSSPSHLQLGVDYFQRVATLAALGHAIHLERRGVRTGLRSDGSDWWTFVDWIPGSPPVPNRIQYLAAGYAFALHCAVSGVTWGSWVDFLAGRRDDLTAHVYFMGQASGQVSHQAEQGQTVVSSPPPADGGGSPGGGGVGVSSAGGRLWLVGVPAALAVFLLLRRRRW